LLTYDKLYENIKELREKEYFTKEFISPLLEIRTNKRGILKDMQKEAIFDLL